MTLNYLFKVKVDAKDFDYDISFDVNETCIKLITAFLFEKKFGVPYRDLGWWLEPEAKPWVKEIEDAWFNNKLEYLSFRDDYVDFLYSYFRDEAIKDLKTQLQQELMNDVGFDEDTLVVVHLGEEEVLDSADFN